MPSGLHSFLFISVLFHLSWDLSKISVIISKWGNKGRLVQKRRNSWNKHEIISLVWIKISIHTQRWFVEIYFLQPTVRWAGNTNEHLLSSAHDAQFHAGCPSASLLAAAWISSEIYLLPCLIKHFTAVCHVRFFMLPSQCTKKGCGLSLWIFVSRLISLQACSSRWRWMASHWCKLYAVQIEQLSKQ